jgi:hypothetical protein
MLETWSQVESNLAKLCPEDLGMVQQRLFKSFNPSGSAILGCLASVILIGFGIMVGDTALSLANSSSLLCHRERGSVLCELRKVYPGGWTTVDRFPLTSVSAEQRESFSVRNQSGSYYEILVLNSEIELGTGGNSWRLATVLNELLSGEASSSGPIRLRQPSYGDAFFLALLAALLSGVGALVMLAVLTGRTDRVSSR